MMTETPLFTDIQQWTTYYNQLINLIPVDYYYPDTNNNVLDTNVPVYKSTKRKRNDYIDPDTNNNNKLNRYNPLYYRTVTSVQYELELLQQNKSIDNTMISHKTKQPTTHKNKSIESTSSDNDNESDHNRSSDRAGSDVHDSDNDSDHDIQQPNKKHANNTTNPVTNTSTSNQESTPAAPTPVISIDTLRQRLQAKIALITPKRRVDKQLSDTDKSKLKATLNQQKMKRKQMLQQQRKVNKSNNSMNNAATHTPKDDNHDYNSSDNRDMSAINTDDIQYSKLHIDDAPSIGHVLSGDQLRSGSNKQSAKQQLINIDKYHTKLNELRESGQHEQAEQLIKQHEYAHALLRTQGIAVRDNKSLLNKSIKQKQSQRSKSTKGWNDRIKQQKLQHQKADEKKQQNIEKRLKTSKKNKKSKVGSAPGFGSTGKFINN